MNISRIIIPILFAATVMPTFAARLRVQGEVTDLSSRRPLPGVLVRIYKDGVRLQMKTTGPSGKYDVLLDNNATYVIRFSMPGRVTKCFSVETHGPAWENDGRVVPLEVEMTMFEKAEDLDLTFFDLPLGIARFTPMTGHLAWNTAYEERVRPEVDRLMAELRLRREALTVYQENRSR